MEVNAHGAAAGQPPKSVDEVSPGVGEGMLVFKG